MNSKYDKPYPNGFYNKGTGEDTPITAEILNNLTAFLESIPEIEHGTTPAFRCEQQAMTTYHVDFGHVFRSAPTVVVGFRSTTESRNFGLTQPLVDNVSVTGFDVKVSNTHTAFFEPRVCWIATAG